jgi:sec-independent protein translocase protein TatC
MTQSRNQIDPEDFFADTRMSFGDHIEDLRTHLKRAGCGLLFALIASMTFGHLALAFISAPVEKALGQYHKRRHEKQKQEYLEKAEKSGDLDPREQVLNIPKQDLEKILGHAVAQGAPLSEDGLYVRLTTVVQPRIQVEQWAEMQEKLAPPPSLRTFTIMEAVLVWFKVCLVCGLVLGSPYIFYQVWSFIAAGLYPHEKRLVNHYLPFSVLLFLGGVALCQFVVMPQTIAALLVFNEWLGVEPELRLNDWLTFALLLPLIFGLCFQTPLAMYTLERIGLVSVETYKKHWRIVLFAVAVLYVIISPTPDPMTMILFLAPMYGLYALGIFLCQMAPRRPVADLDAEESEEMIEA